MYDFLLVQSPEIAQLHNFRLAWAASASSRASMGAVRLRRANCGFVEVHLDFPIAVFVRGGV
jgi:hypothetical protein